MTRMRYFLLVAMSFWMGGLQAIRLEGNLPSLEISDGGAVLPGVWNSDVDRVLQKAREENRPSLIVYAKRGCPHCSRLLASMKSETFLKWQRERNILMSVYHKKPNLSLNGKVVGNYSKEDVDPLRKELALYRGKAPLVCVYWPKSDVITVKKMFSGIRGEMLGQKHEKLEVELIQAVDGLLDGYCTTNTLSPLKEGGASTNVHDATLSNNKNSNEVLK